MNVTDLESAINAYEASAAQLYMAAQNALLNPPTAPPPPDPPPPPETRDQFIKRYQGQLSAAFSQFSSVETMRSAQAGREGYAAVVKLMVSTEKAASSICTLLTDLVTPAVGSLTLTSTELTARLPTINALTAALQALAQISPIAIWEKPASSGSTS